MISPSKVSFKYEDPTVDGFNVFCYKKSDDTQVGAVGGLIDTFDVTDDVYSKDISSLPVPPGTAPLGEDLYFSVQAFKGSLVSSIVKGDTFQFSEVLEDPTDIHES